MRVLDRDANAAIALPDGRGERVMSVRNLPAKPGRAKLAPGGAADWGKLVHLFGRGAHQLRQDGSIGGDLTAYGSRWLRVRRAGERLQRRS